jgi:hypothetical protein
VTFDLAAASTRGRIVCDAGAPPLDGDRYTLREVVKPPAPPTLDTIYPASVTIGGPDVLLHCFGSGYARDSLIVIAGHIERTTYMSSYELTTWISMEFWTGPDPGVEVYVRTANGLTPAKSFAVVEAP